MNPERSAEKREFYSFKHIKAEGYYVHDYKDGKWIEYYDIEKINKIKKIRYYKSGEFDGEWVELYIYGNIKTKGAYVYGKKEGE